MKNGGAYRVLICPETKRIDNFGKSEERKLREQLAKRG